MLTRVKLQNKKHEEINGNRSLQLRTPGGGFLQTS